MAIGFSNIPADISVPLFYAEMDNSAANSASSAMRRLTGNPGYQKYSSGNIDQWGYGTTDANGEVFVTFPISFPTAFVSVVATHVGGDGAMVIMLANTATKQGCRLKVRDMGGSVRAGWGVTYFAKGY